MRFILRLIWRYTICRLHGHDWFYLGLSRICTRCWQDEIAYCGGQIHTWWRVRPWQRCACGEKVLTEVLPPERASVSVQSLSLEDVAKVTNLEMQRQAEDYDRILNRKRRHHGSHN